MPALTLRALLNPRSASMAAVKDLCCANGDNLSILDASGKILLGDAPAASSALAAVELNGASLGSVAGPPKAAAALAHVLAHLASRESEQRALASETLHLYREIHLIEQLSEQLAALLDLTAVSESALAQAQRLIPATEGAVLLVDKAAGSLRISAAFALAPDAGDSAAIIAGSPFADSIIEKGVAEVINDCSCDPRFFGISHNPKALICAPLRAGQHTVGLIVLATSDAAVSYSAANLKLLNTIALQTAAAIENAYLAEEMVDTARERAAYAAELKAASSVQQLLLQGASRLTPGFIVESVYLPASEAGGDFFFVEPTDDGSIVAVVGDVSGKGLTAAMRVAMILGVLHREDSFNPAEILFSLNNALIAQEQLGFSTACCIRIASSGEYAYANAGHIAPYLAGRELESVPALPLGLVPDQSYELVRGHLKPGERIVLVSDGVPEARSASGELFGFERLPALTLQSARAIADAAQHFGQEDDITVVALSLAAE
ncbi:MAG: GAF domain-containing SpoIIE family protein phosphatase [Terracidiphilus sp.]